MQSSAVETGFPAFVVASSSLSSSAGTFGNDGGGGHQSAKRPKGGATAAAAKKRNPPLTKRMKLLSLDGYGRRADAFDYSSPSPTSVASFRTDEKKDADVNGDDLMAWTATPTRTTNNVASTGVLSQRQAAGHRRRNSSSSRGSRRRRRQHRQSWTDLRNGTTDVLALACSKRPKSPRSSSYNKRPMNPTSSSTTAFLSPYYYGGGSTSGTSTARDDQDGDEDEQDPTPSLEEIDELYHLLCCHGDAVAQLQVFAVGDDEEDDDDEEDGANDMHDEEEFDQEIAARTETIREQHVREEEEATASATSTAIAPSKEGASEATAALTIASDYDWMRVLPLLGKVSLAKLPVPALSQCVVGALLWQFRNGLRYLDVDVVVDGGTGLVGGNGGACGSRRGRPIPARYWETMATALERHPKLESFMMNQQVDAASWSCLSSSSVCENENNGDTKSRSNRPKKKNSCNDAVALALIGAKNLTTYSQEASSATATSSTEVSESKAMNADKELCFRNGFVEYGIKGQGQYRENGAEGCGDLVQLRFSMLLRMLVECRSLEAFHYENLGFYADDGDDLDDISRYLFEEEAIPAMQEEASESNLTTLTLPRNGIDSEKMIVVTSAVLSVSFFG